MAKKTKFYYKAKRLHFICAFPYVIPAGSLLTLSEIMHYNLHNTLDLSKHFALVELSPSKTKKAHHHFRFEK